MPKYVQQLDVTLPEGEYDFVVADANEKISQSSGNDMIELQLLIKGPDGEEVRITIIWSSRTRRSGKSTNSVSARATSSSRDRKSSSTPRTALTGQARPS